MLEKLKASLKEAEASATNLEIDEIAFLIGCFPKNYWLRQHIADCPRITALLPEMKPCGSEHQALLQVAHCINREDVVGTVAERIRKAVCP